MNCTEFEPLVALYAGRDLDGQDAARVEEHLAACADCRELLEDLQASQAALKYWGSTEVDAAFLTAVRSGVLAGVGDRRRRAWPWVAAFAVAAAMIMAVVWAPRKPAQVPIVRAPEKIGEPVRVAQGQAKPPAPPRRKRVVKRAPEQSKEEPLVVKMLTDDPDIVIIWLVDQRGD